MIDKRPRFNASAPAANEEKIELLIIDEMHGMGMGWTTTCIRNGMDNNVLVS